MTKAGRFGVDAKLSYKGQVNKGKVDKGWVESGAGDPARPGALAAPPDRPCKPLWIPPPEPPG